MTRSLDAGGVSNLCHVGYPTIYSLEPPRSDSELRNANGGDALRPEEVAGRRRRGSERTIKGIEETAATRALIAGVPEFRSQVGQVAVGINGTDDDDISDQPCASVCARCEATL